MEKLLQWSIAQQSGDQEAIAKIGQPDPETLSKLFGTGPDEPTLMKQAIQVVEHPEATLENKQIALENFEMLIENLDNANNIENLKLWPNIIKLLNDEDGDCADDELKLLACSIIGIAVQNNPQSQEAFIGHEGGIEQLIKIGTEYENKSVQLKAIFALSSLLRNFKLAYTKFEQLQGWNIVVTNLSCDDNKVLVRVLSLISAILSNEFNQELLQQQNLIQLLCSILHNQQSNTNIIDKSLSIIADLQRLNYNFTSEDKTNIANSISKVEPMADQLNEDNITDAKRAIE